MVPFSWDKNLKVSMEAMKYSWDNHQITTHKEMPWLNPPIQNLKNIVSLNQEKLAQKLTGHSLGK